VRTFAASGCAELVVHKLPEPAPPRFVRLEAPGPRARLYHQALDAFHALPHKPCRVRNAAEWEAFRLAYCANPPPPIVLPRAPRAARNPDVLLASARRSKALLRRRAMALGLTRIYSLTTRSPVIAEGRMYAMTKEWARRISRVCPAFACAWVHEWQKRGALHAHLLVRPMPVWVTVDGGLVRFNALASSVWASICAEVEGGNFDSGEWVVDKRTGRRYRRKFSRSPLKAVAYVCKYTCKDLDKRTGRRFYWWAPGQSVAGATGKVSREFATWSEAIA